MTISSIEDIIDEARNGRMFILVDEETRENEGDLIIPAQFATPQTINFMAKEGRGLICLAMAKTMIDRLGLDMMVAKNTAQYETAFTVSIEAKEGVTTGISAADRAHTIQVAIDPKSSSDDISTPGHVFPLAAKDGGVLVRAGHTEAAVDISRLAGLRCAGVICEIMNDDGTMARLPDLEKFAAKHDLKIGTIADLIAYRRRNEKLVECLRKDRFSSRFGGAFDLKVYIDKVHYAEHIVLVKGTPSADRPVCVRMHKHNVLHDSLGGGDDDLQKSLEMLAQDDTGVLVLIRVPDAKSVSRSLDDSGEEHHELRSYGVGAQILLDLGVRQMILLSNTQKTIVGLEGYGLEIVEQRQIG